MGLLKMDRGLPHATTDQLPTNVRPRRSKARERLPGPVSGVVTSAMCMSTLGLFASLTGVGFVAAVIFCTGMGWGISPVTERTLRGDHPNITL